jgi:hypothetical protein
MKEVASRLLVCPLAGPLIKPSINGIIAADAINEVNKKSAFLRIFNTAEKSAIRPGIKKASSKLRQSASPAVHQFETVIFARKTAVIKPPR